MADSTRALLESIVAQFDAPIRYAFAYGSGVFEQDGYVATSPTAKDGPMLDFMFAVTHASHWHSINMHQHPSHYPFLARSLGSSFVARVEDINPGVWFNTLVHMNGVVSSSVVLRALDIETLSYLAFLCYCLLSFLALHMLDDQVWRDDR